MPRFESSYPEHQRHEDGVSLHASGAETVTGTGTIEAEVPQARAYLLNAHIEPADAVGDKFDLYIQTYVSAGLATPAWVDVAHFTQILGNGLDVDLFTTINLDEAEALFSPSTALAAGAERHVVGEKWRCRWVIVDGGGTHSFLFTCGIQPMG